MKNAMRKFLRATDDKAKTGLSHLVDLLVGYNFEREVEDWLEHQEESESHILSTMMALERAVNPESYEQSVRYIRTELNRLRALEKRCTKPK